MKRHRPEQDRFHPGIRVGVQRGASEAVRIAPLQHGGVIVDFRGSPRTTIEKRVSTGLTMICPRSFVLPVVLAAGIVSSACLEILCAPPPPQSRELGGGAGLLVAVAICAGFEISHPPPPPGGAKAIASEDSQSGMDGGGHVSQTGIDRSGRILGGY